AKRADAHLERVLQLASRELRNSLQMLQARSHQGAAWAGSPSQVDEHPTSSGVREIESAVQDVCATIESLMYGGGPHIEMVADSVEHAGWQVPERRAAQP